MPLALVTLLLFAGRPHYATVNDSGMLIGEVDRRSDSQWTETGFGLKMSIIFIISGL
jgi:hypothetical protein